MKTRRFWALIPLLSLCFTATTVTAERNHAKNHAKNKASCIPSYTECTSSTSELPCICPRRGPPGGLSPQQVPQFVVFTHDDSVNQESITYIDDVIQNRQHLNGCPIPITWFAMKHNTDCPSIQQRYARGDEIATHTLQHDRLGRDVPIRTMAKTVYGAQSFIVDTCDIPLQDVVGFRSPFLVTNPALRQVLAQGNFTYDATTNAMGDPGNKLYPYTLHRGVADERCDSPKRTWQPCLSSESYKKLFEIPVWSSQYRKQEYPMDPGQGQSWSGKERPVFNVLKHNFDAAYTGNRAPVPLFIHYYWLHNDQRRQGAQKFIDYVLQHHDAYFVTMQQLIQWVKNPVPKEQVDGWLKQHCGSRAGNFRVNKNSSGGSGDHNKLRKQQRQVESEKKHIVLSSKYIDMSSRQSLLLLFGVTAALCAVLARKRIRCC